MTFTFEEYRFLNNNGPTFGKFFYTEKYSDHHGGFHKSPDSLFTPFVMIKIFMNEDHIISLTRNAFQHCAVLQ